MKPTAEQVITQVTAGERVRYLPCGEGRAKLAPVGAYHPTEPSNRLGHWYCVTHEMHFANQFQKDSHIHEGAHRLAWICHEHGIEQPTRSSGETVQVVTQVQS